MAGKIGACSTGRHAVVSSAFPHFGEESVLQGMKDAHFQIIGDLECILFLSTKWICQRLCEARSSVSAEIRLNRTANDLKT